MALEQLLEAYPNSHYVGDARYYLGNIYFWDKQYDKAIQQYRIVVEKYPERIESCYWTFKQLVHIYNKQGKEAEAEAMRALRKEKFPENCRTVIAADEGYDALCAQYFLGAFYGGEEEYDKAREEFAKLIENLPPDAHFSLLARYAIAYTFWHEKRYSEAISEFQKVITEAPNGELADEAQLNIGECLHFDRKYEEAKLAYQKLINEYPDSPLIKRARGGIRSSEIQLEKMRMRGHK